MVDRPITWLTGEDGTTVEWDNANRPGFTHTEIPLEEQVCCFTYPNSAGQSTVVCRFLSKAAILSISELNNSMHTMQMTRHVDLSRTESSCETMQHVQLSWLLHSWVCEEMRLRYDFETIETVRLKQVTIHEAGTLQ